MGLSVSITVEKSAVCRPLMVVVATVTCRCAGTESEVGHHGAVGSCRKRNVTEAFCVPGLSRSIVVWKNVLFEPSAK